MANWWDDINSAISDTGILQAIDPFVRDIIPGYAAAEDIFGINAGSWDPQSGGASNPGANSSNIYGGNYSGGATMDWSQMNIPAGLTLTGPRRIMPYAGGAVPAGYRVARRPARAPQAGRPAGTYLVPRRTMNPLNPRALLRAERRMKGFTHWVKRHFSIASHMPRRKRHSTKGRFTRRR